MVPESATKSLSVVSIAPAANVSPEFTTRVPTNQRYDPKNCSIRLMTKNIGTSDAQVGVGAEGEIVAVADDE